MEEIKGYKLEVCRALAEEQTIIGVQREAFIINVTLAILFIVILKMWYLSWLFILTHFILYKTCKKDPLILKIFFKRYLFQRKYFYEG